MGSDSLLLQARRYINEDCRNGIQFFGQEISHTTYNLARMNMILHNVPFTYQHFRNGDTLGSDWPTEEPTNYDATVMIISSIISSGIRSKQGKPFFSSQIYLAKAA